MDKAVKLPLKCYAEVLKDKTQGKEVMSGKVTALDEEPTRAPPPTDDYRALIPHRL